MEGRAFLLAGIAQPPGPIPSEYITLVESAQGQKTGITAQLPAGKIRADGLTAIEEARLWSTVCRAMDAPKRNAGIPKTQCSCNCRASYFFDQQDREQTWLDIS